METNKRKYLYIGVLTVLFLSVVLITTLPKVGKNTNQPVYGISQKPTLVFCNFTGQVTPVNQGLLNYVVWSDYSNKESINKLNMSRRFSVVNRELAQQYLILSDVGESKLDEVAFSMLEYYACMIPPELYEKLVGLYLAKYEIETPEGKNVERASVLVLEDRETTEYIAKLLMSLTTEEFQQTIINGNLVGYTAQKAYWWTHENMIIRISAHDKPMKADANGNIYDQLDWQPCEALDPFGGLRDSCIYNQFWKEPSAYLVNQYLLKLPSDADQIDFSVPPQSPIGHLPLGPDYNNMQGGCEDTAKRVWEQIIAYMNAVGDQKRYQTRLDDRVKITHLSTSKRWYYLGETVTIFATAVSADGNFGNVFANVNKDIYPNKEFEMVPMQKTQCANRVSFVEKMTGIPV